MTGHFTINPDAPPRSTHRVSNIELARQFYTAHELEFQRASMVEKVADRGFPFTADRFDEWAVNGGHMPKTAKACDDAIERSGINELRYSLRVRLNRSARDGGGLQRAFSVEARGGKWRVVLGERFLAERPREIMNGIASSLKLNDERIAATERMVKEAEHLSDQDKMLNLMRLETVELYIFQGLQLHQLILQQAFNSDQKISLSRLRRGMADLIKREIARGKGRKRAR